MTVRYLTDVDGRVALYDSVTDTAFGPLFSSPEHADDFLDWIAEDARTLTPQVLRIQHDKWRGQRTEEETGELKP